MMRTEDEVRSEFEAAKEKQRRLGIICDTAKARYQAALSATLDMSAVDPDALAAGVVLDAENALRSLRELERRHKEAQDAVNVLRQELYSVTTQPAVDAYLAALEELMPALLDLAERIEAAEAIKAGVKQHDPRVFHVFRLRSDLRSTAQAFGQWIAPKSRRGSWRVLNEGGNVTHIPAAEYERRERARLEKLPPRRFAGGALSGWLK